MLITDELPLYWTVKNSKEVERAINMGQLAQVALEVIGRMQGPIVQVCGPISTGGFGNLRANLARFRLAIWILRDQGRSVFDQLPFQEAMVRIIEEIGSEGYCWAILEEFYGPIFRSGKISRAFFLPLWETSTGTTWERQTVADNGIAIEEFPEEWFTQDRRKLK